MALDRAGTWIRLGYAAVPTPGGGGLVRPAGKLPGVADLVTPRALSRLPRTAAPSRPGSRRPPWPGPRRAAGCDGRRTATPQSRGAQRVRMPGHHTGHTGPLHSAACLVRELRSCRLPRVVPPGHCARQALPYVLDNTLPGGDLPMLSPRTPKANAARRDRRTCPPLATVNMRVAPGGYPCPRRGFTGLSDRAASLRASPPDPRCRLPRPRRVT
jgi:hypothetical protein